MDAHISRLSVQIGLGASALIINDASRRETVQPETSIQHMRLTLRDGPSEAPARGRRCLEAAIAPAAVQEEDGNSAIASSITSSTTASDPR
jgi:hypothetical protein